MLTYLINVSGDLLTVSLITGAILAYFDLFRTQFGRIAVRAGIALGVIISAVRAYITNTRRLTGGWKVGMYGYIVALALFILLIVIFTAYYFAVKRRSKSKEDELSRPARIFEAVLSVVTAALLAAYLYGALPNVYVYPFKFDTGGNGFLSTDFLFRLGGYLLGIIISVIAGVTSYHIIYIAAKKGCVALSRSSFFFLNTIYAVYNFARLMLVLTPRKIVDSIVMFNFAAASNNNDEWYGYISFAFLLFTSLMLLIKSRTSKEPYETNAQHRKQRAMWRSAGRYSLLLVICFTAAIMCSTLFVTLNTVVIREAPTEDPVIIKDGAGNDTELRVPIGYVSDGHLHRFGYKTTSGSVARFIVVLKQEGTGNYGIGLDACEICGEAGYYENNDGQIVCKKCGVVMNRTTIGMKGGCNPIIIDYDINESYITVPVSEMENNSSRFKK